MLLTCISTPSSPALCFNGFKVKVYQYNIVKIAQDVQHRPGAIVDEGALVEDLVVPRSHAARGDKAERLIIVENLIKIDQNLTKLCFSNLVKFGQISIFREFGEIRFFGVFFLGGVEI